MNDFSYPKRNTITIIVITLFVAISLTLLWLTPPADAGPRSPGTTIHGLVVNWGYHNEPHVKVRLKGGGWDLETTSDDNGYYSFQGLGGGIAFLSPILPEGSALKPMTTDLAVQMKGSGQLVVNLGLYTGPTAPTLPVEMSMSVKPKVAGPGSVVVYTIRATNRMAHGISQVLVTDYLPTGLVPVEATASHSTAEIWDNLVITDIGEMAVGDTAVVIIEARIKSNVMPGTVIQNRASLIYAESVAAQAIASLTINGARPIAKPAAPESRGALPVTGFGLSIAGLLFALLILAARRLRPKPADET
jgi:uncharacterized repeat protein (TIGR01451 family)